MKKLLFLPLIFLSLFSTFAQPANVSLAWDGNCSSEVIGYSVQFTTNRLTVPTTNVFEPYLSDCGTNRPGGTNVYFGEYFSTNVVLVEGLTNTSCVVSNLVRGATYYFTALSRTSLLKSFPSNEVEYTIPIVATNSVPTRVGGFRIMLVN